MNDSDKLNGFWEEGYHYYLEIRNETLTVRDYRRAICLTTDISYDADLLESGARTVISLGDNVLSRTYTGDMMTEIRELSYENGQLQLLYYYTIMGETLYTLKKVDRGPFDYITIRDDAYLDQLAGVWKEWTRDGAGLELTICGDVISWCGRELGRFHVVSYDGALDQVYLVPENLIDDTFGVFGKLQVHPDMLTGYMQVFDVSTPMSVFTREEMLDRIRIPEEALRPAVHMMNVPVDEPMRKEMFGMPGNMGMTQCLDPGMADTEKGPEKSRTDPKQTSKSEGTEDGQWKCCPECGFVLNDMPPRFCPNCGMSLRKQC